jgi:hypothetical protein
MLHFAMPSLILTAVASAPVTNHQRATIDVQSAAVSLIAGIF